MSALTFTIPKPLWLSANRPATNFGYRARIVRDLHHLAAAVATSHRLRPIVGQVAVDWSIGYPKGTRKDKGEASNAQPTCKALLDGLVAGGWLTDDGPQYVVSETYRRGPNLDRSNDHTVTLVLAEVELDCPRCDSPVMAADLWGCDHELGPYCGPCCRCWHQDGAA